MSQAKKPYEQIGVAMTCRSYLEYERMFALGPDFAAAGPVLDVAGGASSFVAELRARGVEACAADPLYDMPPNEIHAHGTAEIGISTGKLRSIQEQFDWTFYGSVDNHVAIREGSLSKFIADYGSSDGSRVYSSAKLPHLPYDDETFELAVCSHFLFLYHEQFDYDFHLQAVRELIRVCKAGGEVRIYPVMTLRWDRYPLLDRLMQELASEDVQPELIPANLPFIPGSAELLRLKKRAI